mgnify:CR=1 FL=1
MVLAVSAAHKGDDRNTNLWITITALLGATFVGGQVYEFTTFYREGLGFTTSLFGSSFYALTGFHGVHVSVGVIFLLSTMGIIKKGRITGNKAEVVSWVLKKPMAEHRTAIEASIDRAVQAFPLLLAGEMDKAMVRIHTSKPPRPKHPKPTAATPPPDPS